MPDNTIDIRINLDATESGTPLQKLRQELNRLVADTERASRQQGWAGVRGIEKAVADTRSQITALEQLGAEAEQAKARMEALAAASRQTNQLNLERSLGPEPSRQIITTRRLPAVASSLSMMAVGDEEERAQRQQALTAIVQKESARRAQIVEGESTAASRASQQAAIKRQREEEAIGNAVIRSAAERERAQRVYDTEAEKHEDSFKRQELVQVRAFESYKEQQKKREEVTARTAAITKERAEQETYVTAIKDNKQFDAEKRRQDQLFQQAVRENREFEQTRHRGYYTATAEDQRLGDINQQDILRRMPGRREASAFYAELNAAGDAATGSAVSRFFGRLNRQGALEGQAAVINTVQALASGMDPAHVALMEGTQLGGAAIQGGLVSLNTIFTAMVSPVGLLVTGLTAAAAATITWSASIARANEQMANFQNFAALQGRDAPAARADTAELADRIRLSGFLGRQDSREAAIAIGSISNISPETRASLGRSAEALGRTRFGGDQEEANKFIRSTFSDPMKTKDFADELGLVEGEARKTLDAAAAIGNNFKTAEIAAAALAERLGPINEAQQRARDNEGWVGRNIDIFSWRGQAELARQTGTFSFTSLWQSPGFRTGTTAPHPEIRQGLEASDRQLKVEREINGLIEQRKDLLAAIQRAAGQPVQADFQRALKENEEQIAGTHTPDEERRHTLRLANLEREKSAAEAAAQHDSSQLSRVAQISRQIQQEITNYRTSEAAKRAGIAVEESEKEVAAAKQVDEQIRQIARRRLDLDLQQSALERARMGPANLRGQAASVSQDVNRMRGDQAADEGAITGKRVEEINALRAVRLETEEIHIAQLHQNEAILQAHEDLAGVVRLRKEEAAIVEQSGDRSPLAAIQARTNLIQSQLQTLQHARQLEIQATDSANAAESRRLQTATAYANLQVVGGNATTEQAIQAEQVLTQQVVDGQVKRLQALLQTGNLERSERIRINEQLSALYEQDAQKQIELQTRITQSIREENNRRTENFKNFFSSIEDSSATLLTAGLLKTQTRQDAVKSFASSVVTSFVKETENMASKFAGKGLAKLLDVKLNEGEDSSISNVLAKKAGAVLGITLDEPKLDQAAIADRMKQASDTQKTAADLMLQAAQEMKGGVGKIAPSSPETLERGATSSTAPLSSPARPVTRYDGDTGQKVVSTLRERGWSDAAIQGALNNSLTESSLNPNAKGAAGERGLYQLHPASHIKPFEAAYGGNWSAEAQTNYMADVVERTIPGYSRSVDPEQATADFMRKFERPKDQSIQAVATRFTNNDAASRKIIAATSAPTSGPKTIPLDELAQAAPVQLTTTTPRSDYFLKDIPRTQNYKDIEYKTTPDGEIVSKRELQSKLDEPMDKPVTSGWSKDYYKTLGTPEGPRGADYVFGTKIPRPEVDSEGKIVKYGVDPKQAVADRITVPTENERPSQQIKIDPTPSTQRTVADLVTEANPRYREISGGQDMMTDFRKAWGHPIAEWSTALRLKSAYDDSQIKPLMQQADQTVKTAYPGLDVQNAFVNGKPSLDELLKLNVPETKARDQIIKIDPSSIAMGVQQGQERTLDSVRSSMAEGVVQGQQTSNTTIRSDVQATETNSSTMQTLDSTGKDQVQVTRELIQAFREGKQKGLESVQSGTSISGTYTGSGSISQLSSETQVYNENYQRGLEAGLQGKTSAMSTYGDTVSVGKVTQGVQGVGAGGVAESTGDMAKAASSATTGLSLFSSAAGIASSAALLFGKNLSPTGKAIIGGVGVVSQVLSLGTKIAGLVAAPATGGLSLASLAMEHGGVIPSAAGGMQIDAGRTGLDGKGGRLILGHPREVVLPANLSDGFRRIIESGQGGSINNTNSTNINNTINYSPHATGYHPYRTRSDMENLWRAHNPTIMRLVESAVRNGVYPSRSF